MWYVTKLVLVHKFKGFGGNLGLVYIKYWSWEFNTLIYDAHTYRHHEIKLSHTGFVSKSEINPPQIK